MGAARRVQSLDGLRGLAIVAVICDHAGWIGQSGARGVTTFFVLSGYLITRLLVDERDSQGAISLRGFYLRRAARLGPGTVIAYTTLLICLLAVGIGAALWQWAAVMLESGNLVAAFGDGGTMGHFAASWSLATEEQYYLLWPPVLALLLARGRRHWLVPICALLLAAVSVGRLAALGAGHLNAVYFAPWFRADALLAGCIVGLMATRWKVRPWAGALALVALLWLLLQTRILGDSYVAVGQPLTILATCLVIVHATTLRRTLGNPVLAHIGRVSFGLYLWHDVWRQLDHAGVVHLSGVWWLVLAVATTEASWWLLERRAIRWAHRRSQPGHIPVRNDRAARMGPVTVAG